MKKLSSFMFVFTLSVMAVSAAYAMGNRPQASNGGSDGSPSTVSDTSSSRGQENANMGPGGADSSRPGAQTQNSPMGAGDSSTRPSDTSGAGQ